MARFSLKWLVTIVVASGLFIVLLGLLVGHRPLPLAEIRAVRRGMTMDQVRQLIGKPNAGVAIKGHPVLWSYRFPTNDWACKVYFDREWRVDGLTYWHDGQTIWTIDVSAPYVDDNRRHSREVLATP